MWKDRYIRLEKVQPSSNPEIPTPDENEDYDLSAPVGLPTGYWITGTLMNEPEVGNWLLIARDCRNGELIPGVMNTSVIQSIDDEGDRLVITTVNSVYVLTEQSKTQEDVYLN